MQPSEKVAGKKIEKNNVKVERRKGYKKGKFLKITEKLTRKEQLR